MLIPSVQEEIDRLFTMLTFSLVYRDWQPNTLPREQRRGYNIGALLVNEVNQPVHYGLNCINSTDNATQHGELRAITTYLDTTRRYNLSGFTVYATLEPCIMCAGMITMMEVERVVFGQYDVKYSKAFERLAIDSRSIGGFAPYPRQVVVEPAKNQYCRALDEAFSIYLANSGDEILAKFLATEEARGIFEQAYLAFLNFEPVHQESIPIYENARAFFDKH